MPSGGPSPILLEASKMNKLEPEDAVSICLALGNAAVGAEGTKVAAQLSKKEAEELFAEALKKIDPAKTQKIEAETKNHKKRVDKFDVVEKAQSKLATEMWELADWWSKNIAKEI